MPEPRPPDRDNEEHERRRTNLFLLLIAAAIVVLGVWLVNTMVEMRKMQECAEQGRRNCAPVATPGGRQTW
jgi:hypothetical protein